MTQELSKLKSAIQTSLDNTSKQLQAIDKLKFWGAFLTFISGIATSFFLNVLTYWIPVSFFLITVWNGSAIIKNKKSFTVRSTLKTLKTMNKKTILFNLKRLELLRNTLPMLKALGLIFFISLAVLIYHLTENTNPYNLITSIVIALTCLFWIWSVIALHKTVLRNTVEIEKDPSKNYLLEQILKMFEVKTVFGLISRIMLILVLIVIVFCLSIVALIMTFHTMINVWIVVIVLIIQLAVFFMMSSYFSADASKKELLNTITNYSDLIDKIAYLESQEQINIDEVEKINRLYHIAKKYELKIDDGFIMLNFYWLLTHRTYTDFLIDTNKDENKK